MLFLGWNVCLVYLWVSRFFRWNVRINRHDRRSAIVLHFSEISLSKFLVGWVSFSLVYTEEHDVWHYVVSFEKCVVPVTVFGIDTTKHCGPLSNIDLVHFVWEQFFVSVTKNQHWLSHFAALLSFQNCCFCNITVQKATRGKTLWIVMVCLTSQGYCGTLSEMWPFTWMYL